MAERRPICLIDGRQKMLPAGDTLPGAGGGGGGIAWEETDGSAELDVGKAYRATDDVTLPGTIAEDDELIIHAQGVDVLCDPNGNDVVGPRGTVDGDTDTLKLFNGETAHLVAKSASQWEVV